MASLWTSEGLVLTCVEVPSAVSIIHFSGFYLLLALQWVLDWLGEASRLSGWSQILERKHFVIGYVSQALIHTAPAIVCYPPSYSLLPEPSPSSRSRLLLLPLAGKSDLATYANSQDQPLHVQRSKTGAFIVKLTLPAAHSSEGVTADGARGPV